MSSAKWQLFCLSLNVFTHYSGVCIISYIEPRGYQKDYANITTDGRYLEVAMI